MNQQRPPQHILMNQHPQPQGWRLKGGKLRKREKEKTVFLKNTSHHFPGGSKTWSSDCKVLKENVCTRVLQPNFRVFSNESTLRMRWPKDWSFSFSIRPYNEYSGLISLRMAWFVLLAIQESSLRGQPPNEQNSKHWKPNCCFVIKFHGSL